MNQKNDIDEIFTNPWEWIADMAYAAIDLAKWFVLIAFIGITVGYVPVKFGLI